MGFLDHLDAGTQERLLAAGRRRRFASGQALFAHRDQADDVLVLVAGHVKLVVPTSVGREVVLAVRGSGSLLGELAALDGGERTAGVVALDDVDAVALTGDTFRRLVREHAAVADALHRELVGRLREAGARQVEHVEHDTTGRIAARLVELAVAHGAPEAGGAVRVELLLTQDELGSWTGSSRESVARALATLRRAGWIETGRRAVVVRDLPALRRRAGV